MSEKGVNKSNILSMDKIREKHNQEFKMVEAWVDLEGEMLSYKHYEKFPESKVHEYIQEFQEFNFNLVSNKDYKKLATSSALYSLILLIEKFTDVDVPEDDFEKIAFATHLNDFKLLGSIISTLPEDEVIAVMEKGSDMAEKQTARMKELLEEQIAKTNEIEEFASLRLLEQQEGKSEDKQGE